MTGAGRRQGFLPVFLALFLVFPLLGARVQDDFSPLPPGYGKLWWGAGAEAVRLLAPGPVVARDDPSAALVRLTCPAGEDSSVSTLVYALWRGELFEVELTYDPSYNREIPRDFLVRFTAHFGPWVEQRHQEVNGRQVPVAWLWEDEFTQQRLERDLESGHWKLLRTSLLVGPSPPLPLRPAPVPEEEP